MRPRTNPIPLNSCRIKTNFPWKSFRPKNTNGFNANFGCCQPPLREGVGFSRQPESLKGHDPTEGQFPLKTYSDIAEPVKKPGAVAASIDTTPNLSGNIEQKAWIVRDKIKKILVFLRIRFTHESTSFVLEFLSCIA